MKVSAQLALLGKGLVLWNLIDDIKTIFNDFSIKSTENVLQFQYKLNVKV